MWTADGWNDYRLLDCGDGERIEDWKGYTLIRPDPQAIWPKAAKDIWREPDGVYIRSENGGGRWEIKNLPQSWHISYNDLVFNIKPMSFKHTGVFPEQACNWDFIKSTLKSRKNARVLNLFAYTGGATMAALSAGASVCHVDASKGMVSWAKENAALNGLENAPARYIVDDCVKFVKREINRGNKYDAVIMDPPSYGRGPGKEVWRFEDDVPKFIELCMGVLSDNPLFFLVSSYTTGVSPSVVSYILSNTIARRHGGKVESAELGLRVQSTGLALPCGSAARWTYK